jgi:hypothetical protein
MAAKRGVEESKRQERLKALRVEMAQMGCLILDKHGTDLSAVVREAILHYEGDATVLETAVGALFLAKAFGWKVVRLIHSTKTYSKYERLLSAGFEDGEGFKFANHFEERTGQSDRSHAYRLTEEIGSFWKVARGQVGVPEGQKTIEGIVGIDLLPIDLT